VRVTDRPGISSFKETHTHGHSSCYVVKGQKEEEEALMEPAVNSWARPARNITACVLIARPTSNPHMRHVSPPPTPHRSFHSASRKISFRLYLFCFTTKKKKKTPTVLSTLSQAVTTCYFFLSPFSFFNSFLFSFLEDKVLSKLCDVVSFVLLPNLSECHLLAGARAPSLMRISNRIDYFNPI
jgi:hypothetical protein